MKGITKNYRSKLNALLQNIIIDIKYQISTLPTKELTLDGFYILHPKYNLGELVLKETLKADIEGVYIFFDENQLVQELIRFEDLLPEELLQILHELEFNEKNTEST